MVSVVSSRFRFDAVAVADPSVSRRYDNYLEPETRETKGNKRKRSGASDDIAVRGVAFSWTESEPVRAWYALLPKKFDSLAGELRAALH